jgi:hypothetical protein
MNRLQKSAWYQIAIVVMTATVVSILHFVSGVNTSGGFVLLALLGLDSLLFRRKSAQPPLDERDQQIHRNSLLLAFWGVGVTCFTLTAMAPDYYGENGAIPISHATLVLLGACMLFVFIHAVALLCQYAWGNRNG